MAKLASAPGFGPMSGKIGNLIFTRQANGTTQMRSRKIPANPRTPAQQANRDRFTIATQTWKSLSLAEMQTWEAFTTQTHRAHLNPSLSPTPPAYTVFVSLSTKFLAVNPGNTPPRTAPAEFFSGDGIRIAVSASPGQITFAANIPNSPGVTTEFLIQKLASAGRRGNPKDYRSQGFHTYTSGTLTHTLSAKPGLYLVAVRYTQVSTGQTSELVPFGRVEVGA
ncbi:MAG: hypothetical protein K8R88_00445 [Armatimonadetes bacterium]|nr:hypothetical protein [Armatimonadota bacterium]